MLLLLYYNPSSSVRNMSYYYLLLASFIMLHKYLHYVSSNYHSIILLSVYLSALLCLDMFHLAYSFIMMLRYILSMVYIYLYYYFIHFHLHSMLSLIHYTSFYSVRMPYFHYLLNLMTYFTDSYILMHHVFMLHY